MKHIQPIQILMFFVFSVCPFVSEGVHASQDSNPAPQSAWRQETHGGLKTWIYIPQSSLAPKHLAIFLHGCSQTADDLKKGGNFEAAAEQFGTVVVIPSVPQGGVLMGCWDYYGKNHTEKNRHNSSLVKLAEELLSDPRWPTIGHDLALAGISSGAGQAFVVACLRPDLFKHVGLVAGPILGSEMQDIQSPKQSAEEVSSLCQQFAGAKATNLETMQVSVIHGDQDPIVNTKHSDISREAWLQLTRISSKPVELKMDEEKGSHPQGRGREWLDSSNQVRVSEIVNEGLGHAWPAGNGNGSSANAFGVWLPIAATQNFINSESLDYPWYFLSLMDR